MCVLFTFTPLFLFDYMATVVFSVLEASAKNIVCANIPGNKALSDSDTIFVILNCFEVHLSNIYCKSCIIFNGLIL